MITRRNTLAAIGLSTAAIGVEAAAKEQDVRPAPVHGLDKKRMADALRAFANSVESGEFAIVNMRVASNVSPGDVARNTLSVEFFNRGVG